MVFPKLIWPLDIFTSTWLRPSSVPWSPHKETVALGPALLPSHHMGSVKIRMGPTYFEKPEQ